MGPSAIEQQRMKLWSRIYADVMNGGYLNERITHRAPIAAEIADHALEDFDSRFPKSGAPK